jgi:hypothetical protein
MSGGAFAGRARASVKYQHVTREALKQAMLNEHTRRNQSRRQGKLAELRSGAEHGHFCSFEEHEEGGDDCMPPLQHEDGIGYTSGGAFGLDLADPGVLSYLLELEAEVYSDLAEAAHAAHHETGGAPDDDNDNCAGADWSAESFGAPAPHTSFAEPVAGSWSSAYGQQLIAWPTPPTHDEEAYQLMQWLTSNADAPHHSQPESNTHDQHIAPAW